MGEGMTVCSNAFDNVPPVGPKYMNFVVMILDD